MHDKPPVPESGLRPTQRKRLLIVDPDPAVREWLKPIGEELNAEIFEAATGLELQLMLKRQGPFDLVITNARLASPSGLQVLASVRAAGSDTPFIVVTSFTHNALRVFVSDAEGTVLSSRVVDEENLRVLAQDLIAAPRGGYGSERLG